MQNTRLGRVKKRHYRAIVNARLEKLPLKPKIRFPKPARIKPENSKKSLLKMIFIIFLIIGINTTFGKFKNEVERFTAEAYTSDSLIAQEVKTNNDPKYNAAGFINPKDYLSSSFQTEDKRVFALNEYFRVNESPLYGMAKYFVEACDRYGAPKDCIGMVAVAKHETDLCKYYNSANMHNCWGWGGPGIYRIRFSSFEQSIDIVTGQTMENYGTEFLTDFNNGDERFCGPQDECIGWGNRVNKIADDIDRFAEEIGVGRLTDLR